MFETVNIPLNRSLQGRNRNIKIKRSVKVQFVFYSFKFRQKKTSTFEKFKNQLKQIYLKS